MVTYARDDVHRRIVVTITGEAHTADVLGVIERQVADDAWQYGMLYDSREDTSAPSSADLRAVVDVVGRHIAQLGPRGPVAIVTSQPMNYGMARMYSTLGEPVHINVEVFRELADAEAWLDAQMGPAA
jgi:hypothetical protein